ncbi:PAS domain-containing protein [Mumia flava]|uniref:histidine kinase n=1 Tax=Mumia flava TaxID=1348852 RepID=A0A2M9BCZ6_9ACTN|nr:HAMP domain-containing sensor histidine kinase [Mumia flava]PJJ55818.1 PAS domain-containing protein [Mumia flava]
MSGYDDLPDAVVVADADGCVTDVNAAARRVLRARPEDLVGRHVRDAVALDDLTGHDWFSCLDPYGGLPQRTLLSEQGWYTADGDEILMTGRLVREEPRGPVVRLVLSLRRAHARAYRDRAHSDLVATAAHELRSPLTGVKGFTATLLRNWDRFTDGQRRLMLETVDADADRLSRLITDLLDAARIDSGRLTLRVEPTDVAEHVRAILAGLSLGFEGRIVVVADDELPPVWVDPDRVAQLVTNLVENAERHGQGVRDVRVEAADGDGVRLTVSDFGPGIPEQVRDRMFTRFWKSGDRGGTGLGLYIVKGVADGHGGEIEVLDGPEGGAEVRVWFPQNKPEVLRDEPPA